MPLRLSSHVWTSCHCPRGGPESSVFENSRSWIETQCGLFSDYYVFLNGTVNSCHNEKLCSLPPFVIRGDSLYQMLVSRYFTSTRVYFTLSHDLFNIFYIFT